MRHASMTRASTVRSVISYQARDLVRSRWLAAYTLFFLAASEGLLRYGGGATKALLSLGSIVLFVVPLVFERHGRRINAMLRLVQDPRVEIVPAEDSGRALTAAQQRFRQAWLSSRARNTF